MANANPYNSCTFVGRLTKDPALQTRQGQSGSYSDVIFTVAVNRPHQKNAQGATADFVSFNAKGSTADFVAKYFKKGSSIVVNATYQTYKRNPARQDTNGYDITEHIFAVTAVSFGIGDGHGNHANGQGAKPTPARGNSNVTNQINNFSDDAFEVDELDLPF